MTDEKILQCTICPAYQWGPEVIVKAFFRSLDYFHAHPKTWHFLAAGIPVSSKRRSKQAGVADSGTQDCVYSKASDQFAPPSQTTDEIDRRIPEWGGGASLRRISQKARPWLRNFLERFRRNIFLTDRFSGSFLKFIVCWFPKEKNFMTRKKHV